MLSFDGIETQQQNERSSNDSHQNVPHASSGHQAKLSANRGCNRTVHELIQYVDIRSMEKFSN